MFASKNSVFPSILDGLGMGIGFTVALFLMATVREVFGAGTFMSGINGLLSVFSDTSFNGFSVPFLNENPMLVFILPPGGFFVFGVLMATVNRLAEKNGKPKAELKGCEACPMARSCSLKTCENKGKEAAE